MHVPLAEKLRPKSFDQVAGQDELIPVLKQITEKGKPLSLLFWGPPGTGKTTLARLYAQAFDREFISLSAIFSGVGEIKKILSNLNKAPLLHKNPVVFMDEIHRFNKAQQDAFLPLIEKGIFTLIGATTENPSFSLNNALLSRLRVYTLNSLSKSALESILQSYINQIRPLPFTEEAKEWVLELASGDGRYLLNLLETLNSISSEKPLSKEEIVPFLQKKPALYDKKDEGHYNLISALHKSVRGSDPDAALYWLARMLNGGEDPHFLARRLVRMATEDIGLADPHALQITMNAWQAYERLGSPEGDLALAEAVIYLALSPKSNRTYIAYKKAIALAEKTAELDPPKSILNAPTKLMKKLGYGKNYAYDHDLPDAFSGAEYFPEGVQRENFYRPVNRGFERELEKRSNYFAKLKSERTGDRSSPKATQDS